jgi:glycerol transport system ATP-binding protein
MAEIVLHAISHSYDVERGGLEPPVRGRAPTLVLRDVELRWRAGGAYALLGPSGCGKTTLLGIISGLIQPTRGEVRYDGKDVTTWSSRERNIAQVFQFPVVYDTMTVRQNLAFPLHNRGLARGDIERRVERVADALELTAMLPVRATGLTADQKQILALGRGLVRDDVAAILFDEPLTVIDPHRKWLLRRKLKEIHKQFGHTLIYVTHDQTEALTFADEVVVMQHGEVLQRGTPEQLARRPAHTYVGYFIGSPGMNIVACELAHAGGAARLQVGDHAIGLPASALALAAGAVELGIRPEHVAVVPGGWRDPATDPAADPAADLASGAAPSLALTVSAVEDHGRFRIVTGRIAGATERFKLRISSSAPVRQADQIQPVLAPGETLAIALSLDHLCLYRDHKLVWPIDDATEAAR